MHSSPDFQTFSTQAVNLTINVTTDANSLAYLLTYLLPSLLVLSLFCVLAYACTYPQDSGGMLPDNCKRLLDYAEQRQPRLRNLASVTQV